MLEILEFIFANFRNYIGTVFIIGLLCATAITCTTEIAKIGRKNFYLNDKDEH